jgi:hypothetical protein
MAMVIPIIEPLDATISMPVRLCGRADSNELQG